MFDLIKSSRMSQKNLRTTKGWKSPLRHINLNGELITYEL